MANGKNIGFLLATSFGFIFMLLHVLVSNSFLQNAVIEVME